MRNIRRQHPLPWSVIMPLIGFVDLRQAIAGQKRPQTHDTHGCSPTRVSVPSPDKSCSRKLAFRCQKLIREGHLWCLYMHADNALSSGLADLFWSCFIYADCLGASQRTSDPEHGDGVGYRSTR